MKPKEIRNHKQEYPYNYEYLEREMKEAMSQLKLIVDDLSGDPQLFIKRTIQDLQKAINHTKENLNHAKNSPENT